MRSQISNRAIPLSAPEISDTCCAERRTEDRHAACGPVEFEVDGFFADQFLGELVELSAHGMRIIHNCLRLDRNMRIRFRHPFGEGVARAVWNRRNGTNVESGFRLEE